MHRTAHEVRVVRDGLDVGMAEQFGDDGERLAEHQGPAGV